MKLYTKMYGKFLWWVKIPDIINDENILNQIMIGAGYLLFPWWPLLLNEQECYYRWISLLICTMVPIAMATVRMDLTHWLEIAWCRQATSHCLSQYWPGCMSAYGVIRSQWVDHDDYVDDDHGDNDDSMMMATNRSRMNSVLEVESIGPGMPNRLALCIDWAYKLYSCLQRGNTVWLQNPRIVVYSWWLWKFSLEVCSHNAAIQSNFEVVYMFLYVCACIYRDTHTIYNRWQRERERDNERERVRKTQRYDDQEREKRQRERES